MLLEAGADPNIETWGAAAQSCGPLSPRSPSQSPHSPTTATTGYTPPTAGKYQQLQCDLNTYITILILDKTDDSIHATESANKSVNKYNNYISMTALSLK